MGYNKSIAESEWKEEWDKKEKLLRENGCSEILIKELHDFEWKQFNRDRKFYEHLDDYEDGFIERYPEKPKPREVNTVEDIFEIIQDKELLYHLRRADNDVLVFFVMSANDYKIREIAETLHVTSNEIYGKVYRFRKKISKYRKNDCFRGLLSEGGSSLNLLPPLIFDIADTTFRS